MLVGACQANPEPSPFAGPESTAPVATPPSASPTATPPELPRAATGTDRAAAKAFVRHWVEVLNYAGPATDGDPLRELSARSCAACHAIADFLDDVEAAGGAIEGRGWRIKKIKVISARPGEPVVLDVLTRVHPQTVTTAAGRPPETFGGGKRLKTFWVDREGGAWQVTRLDQPS
jgi:hypothetical protein